MSESIRVAVVGAAGRMGRTALRALAAEPGLAVVGGFDHKEAGASLASLAEAPALEGLALRVDWPAAAASLRPDVLLDLSLGSAVEANALAALEAGCAPVIGASGVPEPAVAAIRDACARTGVPALLVPNFAIGAVLLMRFAAEAARWFPDVEIVEMHHERKADAPSGTALRTAELIADARRSAPAPKPEAIEKATGALGARWAGVPVHSVRLPGLVAHQTVLFGAPGEGLSLRHDSTDRSSFMPGVLLAVRQVRRLSGFAIGLEHVLELER